MDSKPKKTLLIILLPALFIVLAGLGVILLCKADAPNISAAAEKSKAPKKQSPSEAKKVVLRSALAGSWYPADANKLRKQIDGFFQKAKVGPKDNVIGLILPHAGYRYSGQTAAAAIKTIARQYKRVVIIGPSHRAPLENMLTVPRVTHYETPLGQIPLDTEFIKGLLKFQIFQNLPYVHRYEHSVQIELPLLQHRLKSFKLVPIVAGTCSAETVKKAGRILAGMIDTETLVIASSDFVHYGPRYGYTPFKENIAEQIKKLDMGAYKYIAGLDSDSFLQYRHRTGATICGYVPIAILLSMLDKSTEVRLIKYATSGRLMGDFTNSVSYLSTAFTGTWKNRPKIETRPGSTELTDQDKRTLLTLARKTILYALKNQRVPQPEDLGLQTTPVMKIPRAAFVTLKKNSLLRGCIGDIFPQRPLYKSIIRNAINAAFNDRRFSRLKKDECNDVTVEISALTQPEPVSGPNEIKIGTHGVVLSKNGKSAVYLPQVAPEQGWDLNQTLTHLSQKAGLPPDAWKQGAQFLVFQAVVFGEEK